MHTSLLTPSNASGQVFDLCFWGQRALVVVEGSVGRDELVKYLQKHPHQVGAWTQDTVNELELDLDYFTDVLSWG